MCCFSSGYTTVIFTSSHTTFPLSISQYQQVNINIVKTWTVRTPDQKFSDSKNLFSSQRSFEYLRLTSLGVIGALVKTDENDVINFLLTTEIVPLCLNIMETGSELSKTVATFILQKILVDNAGLEYICAVSFSIIKPISEI